MSDWENTYTMLIAAILDIEETDEPVDQVLVDRAEELTAMLNVLRNDINASITEYRCRLDGATKWN